MKKRIIGVVVAVALIVSSVFVYNHFNGDVITVFAAEFRDGFVIEPTSIDNTGVHINSDFIFKWEDDKEPVTTEELREKLSVSPTIEFEITENSGGLLIHPINDLESNTVYVFDYLGITFAYKTEADFALMGTFPRNQTTNVPVNTGIEFVFNYEGADVSDYFEIEPSVNGRFEQHGRVVVFVPKELTEATVYTVTLKEGVPLKGSTKALEEGLSFSFETESKNGFDEPKAYVNFRSMISEYKTDEAPELFWDFHKYDGEFAEKANIKIYAYKKVEEFINDLNSYTFMPYWSWYGLEDMTISTDGLKKVMDFDYDMIDDGAYPQILTLPDALDQGFYIAEVDWDDAHAQAFFQVTDLGFYYSQNANGDLFWTHNLKTGNALEGVKVTEYLGDLDEQLVKNDRTTVSNNEGIINLLDERSGERNKENGMTKIYHLEKDGMQSVCFSMNSDFWGSRYYDNQNYWKYFKSDRSLYKPDDTVKFFGFLKARYEDVDIDKVSVEISQGGFYYWEYLPYNTDSLSFVTEDVSVENGFFDGNITLPNLQQGGYELKVKFEDKVVASTYITVEEYIKPSYKIEVSKDKEAIFVEEPINITISSKFFEGTPVSYLDFEYNIGGIDYMDDRDQTDKKGEFTINYTPSYRNGYQGEYGHHISAYAQLPESGNIWASDYFRVFLNDIDVASKATLEGEKGELSFDVHSITLDRINDGSAKDYSDYLDKPVEGQKIDGTIFRNEWIKTERGEYYDFINKEVRKQYDYNLKTTKHTEIEVITDSNGQANKELTLPKIDNVYYTGKFSTRDLNQRLIEINVYFGEYRSYEPSWGDYYHIELDRESYIVGDKIKAEFVNKEVKLDGEFLFISAQNGIIDYSVSESSSKIVEYKTEYIPNIDIAGIYFNGKTYISGGSAMARFDYSTNEINLEIITDKEGYKPGEEMIVTLKGTVIDENGKQVPVADGVVNIGLVDEALLALRDQTINPLEEMYRYVSSGMYQSYSSHYNQNFMHFGGRGAGIDDAKEESAMVNMAEPMSPVLTSVESTTADGESIAVRSEFKDTALFTMVKLNDKGEAEIKLTLPHNVTSWRLTGAAISKELKAGSEVEAVKVSLPFFLNTTMSNTYLVGDKPMIGVTAYGSEVKDDEEIEFVVNVYDSSDTILTSNRVNGLVFERVNLPLGTLTKPGEYKVVIKGMLDDGTGDGLELPITVVNTYHEQLITDYYELIDGLTLKTNESGNTTLTFIDEGRGFYLPTLYRLAYSSGKRVDQQYLGEKVKQYLNDNFESDYKVIDINLSDYKDPNGGIGILPYAGHDIETTINMIPLIKDDISELSLAMYLENAWYNKDLTDKGMVLYGLVQLSKPVLMDLNSYGRIENLSDKDKLYVSLAYAEIGDTYMAKKLYNEVSEGRIKEFETRAYINVGSNEDINYELTALAMVIAEKVNLPIHEKFYDYVISTYSKEVLVNTHLYNYVISRMKQMDKATGTITYEYNGQVKELSLDGGYARSITVPSLTLNSFKVIDITGDMKVAATYLTSKVGQFNNDKDIMVTRRYFNYQTNKEQTTFKEGDIVKVVLEWEVKDEAIDNYYKLSDFAPAGLKPIDNPWQLGLRSESGYMWYRDVDGQKVDFYIYKDVKEHRYESLVYYARISSIGEYKAEAPIIQGTRIMDSMFIGAQDTIIITD